MTGTETQEKLIRVRTWLESLNPAVGATLTPEEAEAAMIVTMRIIQGESPVGRSDAANIVACLNPDHGEWSRVPVPREEVPLWQKYGFLPEEALLWLDAHLSLEDVPRWHKWESPNEVAKWKSSNMKPEDCVAWAKYGVAPERAEEWNRSFVGYAVDEAAKWLNFFPEVSVREVYIMMSSHEDIVDAAMWASFSIPPGQVSIWKAKSYTPEQASLKVEEGVLANKAPHLRPELALRGREWKKISRIMTSLGWELISVDVGWLDSEKFLLFHKGGKYAKMLFKGRRFLEGWGVDQRRIFNFPAFAKVVLGVPASTDCHFEPR